MNGCTGFFSYQDTALPEYSYSNHLNHPNSVLLYKTCPASYRGSAMSSDASMKYVSPGLHDLYKILQFRGHFGRVIHVVLLNCLRLKFRRVVNTQLFRNEKLISDKAKSLPFSKEGV